MRIAVCIKQVLDPEIPARAFRVDESGTRPAIDGVPAARVADSYAENALELGLQLRDKTAGSTLTAVCVGDADSDEVLRRAFALTANATVRAWDAEWCNIDALGASHVIARVLDVIGGADLVLCGRQASDIEESVLGPALAEELGMPCITSAGHIESTGQGITVEREADGLLLTVHSSLPVVVTVSSSPTNVPRMAKVRDVVLAKRKPITVFGTADLALDPERVAPGARIERLTLPRSEHLCEMIGGTDVGAQAALLASRLRELRLL